MLKDEEFTLELTGTDSSNQNSPAKRPHRDLAQMMCCLLHASELGSKFWSFAIAHAVYVKNRLYHSALNTTPFQAFTGRRPDLSRLRIFGSRIYARKTGNRPAKLDHHTSEGIFLTYTATDNSVYYLDDETGQIKIGQHVIFDDAHMTVPAGRAPLAAQALQCLGYHVKESWIQDELKSTATSSDLQVQLITPTAKLPTRGTKDSIGYDLYLDGPEITIAPGSLELLPTGIAALPPTDTYIRFAPRSGLTVKKKLNTMAGVIDPDNTGNITVVIHNFGTEQQIFKRGDKIAQMVIENASTPTILEVENLTPTIRGDQGFGSTDCDNDDIEHPPASDKPVKDPHIPRPRKPPKTDTLQVTAMEKQAITKDLHLSYAAPYSIGLSSSPLDNQTFQTVTTFGNNPTLGFDLHTCPHFGLPQVNDCKASTPCARVPRWRSELRKAYITSVNGEPVATVNEFKMKISEARKTNKTEVEIGFATIERSAMHPQLGILQLYTDQLNIIGEHLWELRHDPEWQSDVEEALPCLKVMKKDAYQELSEEDKTALHKALQATSVKKQRKLTRRLLQQQPDWHDWKESEFKQLDQYKDQDTFGEPQPKPHGANLLSLLWCFLIKDVGRKLVVSVTVIKTDVEL